MIALKALTRHSLNFSDILKPILPQFLLLPQMCVGSTFLLFFSKYSCVYILCLWACPNLYAFYTSDFFSFHCSALAHPVTPVTLASRTQAYQRRPRCMSYSSLSRQFQWQQSIFKQYRIRPMFVEAFYQHWRKTNQQQPKVIQELCHTGWFF